MTNLKINTENKLQNYAIKGLRSISCLCYKFSSPAKRGVPDVLVIPPRGKIFFIEFKNPNQKGKLSALQVVEISRMRAKGARVLVISKVTEVDSLIYSLMNVRCD